MVSIADCKLSNSIITIYQEVVHSNRVIVIPKIIPFEALQQFSFSHSFQCNPPVSLPSIALFLPTTTDMSPCLTLGVRPGVKALGRIK